MSETTLSKHPALTREIGPVVAISKRLASRYSNLLRAGWAAGEIKEVAGCRMIWIQAPGEEVPGIVERLLAARLKWLDRVVAVLDPDTDSSALSALATCGAAVASATHAPPGVPGLMLAEGDPEALARLRPVWKRAHLRVVELKPGAKPVYLAGLTAAGALAAPVLDVGVRCLRHAGLDQQTTRRILGAMIEGALRSFQAHGRKSWVNPASGGRQELVRRQIEAARAADAEMGAFLETLVEASLLWMGQEGLEETDTADGPGKFSLQSA